jgi:hypothetical protein
MDISILKLFSWGQSLAAFGVFARVDEFYSENIGVVYRGAGASRGIIHNIQRG